MLVLLVVVIVLNLLDAFRVVNLDSFADRLPSRMVSVLLPSQSFKHRDTATVQPISGVDSFNAAGDTAPAAVEPEDDFGDAGDFSESDAFDTGSDFDTADDFDAEPEAEVPAQPETPVQNSVG